MRPDSQHSTPSLSKEKHEYKGSGTSINSWNKKKYTPKIITSEEYERFRLEVHKGFKQLHYLTAYYVTLFDTLRYTGM
jgi:hypothetical protein